MEDTVAWRQFLGLTLSSLSRLPSDADATEVVESLGSTLQLLVQPAAARAAVRMAVTASEGTSLSWVLPLLLPLLRRGFSKGPGGTRGDLLALLGGLRFLQMGRSSGLQLANLKLELKPFLWFHEIPLWEASWNQGTVSSWMPPFLFTVQSTGVYLETY